MQLLISSSWWFIILCLVAGAVYAIILYRKKNNLIWYKILAFVRFITVSILCFLLLSPLLVQNTKIVQKPIVLMVMDNTQSIITSKDSNFYKNEFKKNWFNARSQLGSDYEVQYLTYGSAVNVSDSIFYSEKRSNIGKIYDYINNTYAKQNVGAVVVASDGIYNRGNKPLYKHLDNHVSLFTIGMGDSSTKKDLILKDLSMNSIAYLGNDFPIEINLAAYDCQNANTTLTVTIDGKIIFSELVNVNTNDYFRTVNLVAQAGTINGSINEQIGTKHIIATLTTLDGEVSKINNRKDAFIEIIDGREKILLAYNGPHPDVGAIKEAIAANSNYEINAMPVANVKISDINTYSVVILHQLPSKTIRANEIISACRQYKVPIWGITGNQSNLDLLPSISPLTKITGHQSRMNESQAVFNNNFNSFTFSDEGKQTVAGFPPLKTPYGNYVATEHSEILLYQKIGAVSTKLPLWTLMNENGEKTAMLFGEGFWRWRLADFAEHGNHTISNEMVGKTIQYLATKEDKRKFRVIPSKNVYEEDEAVKFIAELYNNNYELVNQVDVKIELMDRDAKVFKYTFSPYNKSYQLNIGNMPAGIYKFKATATGFPEIITGQILITPLQTELINTKADFGLLRQMAAQHNGTFEKPQALQNTINTIKLNSNITSTSYLEKKINELISMKWLFFLILFLLSLEWLVRKYEGGI